MALGIEIRKEDPETKKLVNALNHGISHSIALCERAFLAALQGGCQVPIGAYTEVKDGRLSLEGLIASPNGERVIRNKISGPIDRSVKIGEELGKMLLDMGGKEILESIRTAG